MIFIFNLQFLIFIDIRNAMLIDLDRNILRFMRMVFISKKYTSKPKDEQRQTSSPYLTRRSYGLKLVLCIIICKDKKNTDINSKIWFKLRVSA